MPKILITNECSGPRLIHVEPWGEDYTLLSDEELEIRTEESEAHFEIVESPDCTQVYVENGDDYSVWQGEQKLECGHNRQGDA